MEEQGSRRGATSKAADSGSGSARGSAKVDTEGIAIDNGDRNTSQRGSQAAKGTVDGSGNGAPSSRVAAPASPSQERGLKRSPSKELERVEMAEDAGAAGGTGARGGGHHRAGKGKVPRNRTSSSGRGTVTTAAALSAEGGATSRRTRGSSVA